MTKHTNESQRETDPAHQTVQQSRQPVFFYDGGFRTWAQVEHRAKLNQAISRMTTTAQSR